jgi:hypothetical protein
MVRFSKEISIGSIAQLLGSVLMFVWFMAQIAANQTAMERRIDQMSGQIQTLSGRMDTHLDKAK